MKYLFAAALIGASLLSACQQQPNSSVMKEIEKAEAESAKAAESAAAASQAFLDQNKAKPGVKTTESGLQYEVVRAAPASKPHPGPTDEVTVHYEGTLPDGTVFDSSYQRNEPTSFPLNAVIPGWTEGLQLMRPGEEFRFVIPSDLAYGPQGAGPDIGPNQVLVFKVELLSFKKADGTVVK
ncbi:MAG: FKBP-type peptidyl-prolyl cis-trans isomerase [Alphaproteobacteria bacterium]|nr:FKBP-type peptidyl-prolyl cis-trans isomerase [Alphaproteobacteria bacterium]